MFVGGIFAPSKSVDPYNSPTLPALHTMPAAIKRFSEVVHNIFTICACIQKKMLISYSRILTQDKFLH